MKYLRGISVFVLMLCVKICSAQSAPDFGNTLRSNGRIYVVIAVLVAIFLGLILYMIRVERKISKIEK